MKKSVLFKFVLSILLVVMSATVIGCMSSDEQGATSEESISSSMPSGGDVTNGQVPVYQGMTIHGDAHLFGSYGMSTTNVSNSFDKKKDEEEDDEEWDGEVCECGKVHDDNGNHKGHYKGDDSNEEEPDEENPFPDNTDDENIEEEIKSTLEVIGADSEIYYAGLNEDIYIHVHISNPDNYEILSFTLNGQKYSSYMFEKGSDMETLILKYNVGNNSGVQEYTIDAIKYIDGTEIKDVIIDGDKTVKAGVWRENQVAATVSNLNVESNDVAFNVNVQDNDGLIAYSNGQLKAVIYDGESLVASKDLVVGDNSVAFDGLATNTVYQYAIIGYYDNFIDGFGMKVLYKSVFKTQAIVLFDQITVGYTYIDFNFVWKENFANKTLSSLKLYRKGVIVQELNVTDTSVSNLLTNTTYVLVAEYINLGNVESIKLTFITGEKIVPQITLSLGQVTHSSINFAITEIDNDGVGQITKIELLHGNDEPVIASSVDERQFTNLLSNNDYAVRITYVYNLGDGTGEHVITREVSAKTVAKTTPTITLTKGNVTQNSIAFSITENDIDNVGQITKIELLHGNDELVVANSIDVREFTNLLSNNDYTVKVTYVYNLGDGTGEHVLTKEFTAKTVAKQEPTVAITLGEKTLTTIPFDLQITGADNLCAIEQIVLKDKEGNVVATISTDQREFTQVSIYNDYTICVEYKFDLNDGNGEVCKTVELFIEKGHHNLWFSFYSNEYSVIGLGSFSGEELVIPSTHNGIPVTSIGYCAFEYCDSLTSVEIPDSVTTIGNGAFSFCSSLTSVEIGDSVTTIGNGAFYNCTSLTSVVIPDSVTTIGDEAFAYCYSLTSIVIPDSVTTIGNGAFYECDSLTSLVIPDSVTTIGERAFSECDSLTSLVIGNSVTTIGYQAFSFCDSLTSVVIGDSVTTIGEWAFAWCYSLTSVVIGDSVTTIGDEAFAWCYSLTRIYYKGLASDWENISINSDNSSLENATRYYYVEKEADVPTDGGNYWHYDENGEIAIW